MQFYIRNKYVFKHSIYFSWTSSAEEELDNIPWFKFAVLKLIGDI